jgi:hypothetical protein
LDDKDVEIKKPVKSKNKSKKDSKKKFDYNSDEMQDDDEDGVDDNVERLIEESSYAEASEDKDDLVYSTNSLLGDVKSKKVENKKKDDVFDRWFAK